MLSLLVGLGSGFAAVLLKNIIHLASLILTKNFESPNESYQYLVYPGIGILITVLFVRYFVKADINHGISKVLESISRQKSQIKPHNMFTSMIIQHHHHWIRRICRSRSSRCTHWFCDRIRYCPLLWNELPDDDPSCWMRRCGRNIRDFQSSFCRIAFCH